MNSVEINSIRAQIYNELIRSEHVDDETKNLLKKEAQERANKKLSS